MNGINASQTKPMMWDKTLNKLIMMTDQNIFSPNLLKIVFLLIIMSSLTVMSWNVRGIMSSTVCLSELINLFKCDICIVSEHKLKERSLRYLSTIERGYNCICKADDIPDNYSAYHGKGGIAILYKSTLQFHINEIYDTNSERIVGIELKKASLMVRCSYLVSTYPLMKT